MRSGELYNYAVDNTLSFSDYDLSIVKYQMEWAADIAITWFNNNCMQANAAKFQVVLLTRNKNNRDLTINIQNCELVSQNHVKLLGINIDTKLNFSHHISEICGKAAYQLSGLSKVSKILNKECKMKIFNAFIISNFNYCPLIWHLCTKSDTLKTKKLQERSL